MGKGLRASLTFTAMSGVIAWTQVAVAFVPTAHPWRATPERFLLTTPDAANANVSPVIDRLGLHVYSYRPDGSVAIVWGADAVAPSNLSDEVAREFALGLVTTMAPQLGVAASDLYVRDSLMLEGWGNVTVGQTFLGVEVPSGFVQVTFRQGQVAAIRNELVHHGLTKIAPTLAPKVATDSALAQALQFSDDSQLVAAATLELWTAGDLPEDARLAYAVRTRSTKRPSQLTFHIDADDGAILAVDDDVKFADGEGRVRIVVDAVEPGGTQEAHTATYLDLGNGATDSDGEAQQVNPGNVSYVGPLVRIRDSSGTQVEQFDVDISGPFGIFDHTPQYFSQADPFVHLNLVKLVAAQVTPTLGWLGERLTANVNINDTCNAFWDGQTVNFFRSGGGCNNTGRISSIIYHEFGHGYHGNLTRNTVGSIGEGTGDFLAGTILNDPIVGRGFSTNGSGIRRMDRLHVYPADYVGEVHEDGLIWATALWDLRAALHQKHGEWAGQIAVNHAFALALTEGPGLSTAYPAVLSADDDDNNPNNGTPNSCEINAIFDAHGLVDGGQINHQAVPTRSFVRINHTPPGRIALGAEGAVIEASTENRSNCGSYDPNALKLYYAIGDAPTFQPAAVTSAGANATAVIGGVAAGDTIRYYFEIEGDGTTFMNGSADVPHVALVDLDDQELFAEGFESGLGEWTHGTVGSDQFDDWEAGAPQGLRFDPYDAFSGNAVAGTDLGSGGGVGGTNGAAKAGRSTFLESPVVTTEGMENIRLELWQHYVIDGSLRIVVDGQTIYDFTNDGSEWSDGWRYMTFALPESVKDRADGFTIRFEVDAGPNNTRGGWTIDNVLVSGAMIPPPPPPPPPPEDPPPKDPGDPSPDPMNPSPNPMNPGPGVDPQNPQAPLDPDAKARTPLVRGGLGGGCVCAGRAPSEFSALALLVLGGALLGLRRRR